MSNKNTVEWLSEAIGEATRSAKFCASGFLPNVDPGIEVDGLGTLELPLKRTKKTALIDCCQVAPYGKGTQTLVDKKVRNTYELDGKKIHLSDEWNAAIESALRSVEVQLGLPAERLKAKLYKLLVYQKGGFFLPHRDSEKNDRMVASLIVALPNRFEGGTLIVRHRDVRQKLTFSEAAEGKSPCYAAFYADCEHEVERVNDGLRLCLAYNLVLEPKRAKSPAQAKAAIPSDDIAESIGSWVAMQPATPLVFALEHYYTQRGLTLDLFKGEDRYLANRIVAAAENANCLVYLAQVTRHLLQFADDGSFERNYYRKRYSRSPVQTEFEIGETFEDDLIGTQWTDINGRKQLWEEISFEPSAIVSSEPIEDWKPTSEDYEGYTGNAGNTLDRWYHRSAVVVWHRGQHFDVVARAGAAKCMPLFCSMSAKLAKTPKKRLEAARLDAIRFARALVARWPQVRRYWHSVTREQSPLDDFPDHLLMLHDRETISLFLKKLAEVDLLLPLNPFILEVCREFGWLAFAQELKQLISCKPDRHEIQDVPLRDIEWLSATCCDPAVDPDKRELTDELCILVVERFSEPPSSESMRNSIHRPGELSLSEKSLPLLLRALVASGRDEELSRVIRFVQQTQDKFDMDDCQVPCLKSLIQWSRKRLGSVHPQLASWLTSIRQKLQNATARKPVPPADWARQADVACTCQYCTRLKAFLADPNDEVGRIAANEHMRTHVEHAIQKHQCDVKSVLERKGSPYSLVLTKTQKSFERALQRFDKDCKLLSELQPLTVD